MKRPGGSFLVFQARWNLGCLRGNQGGRKLAGVPSVHRFFPELAFGSRELTFLDPSIPPGKLPFQDSFGRVINAQRPRFSGTAIPA